MNAPFRVGIVGLDTSHAVGFSDVFLGPELRDRIAVTAVYPWGSRSIESSTSRLPAHRQLFADRAIPEVGSIEELIDDVDGVLLETHDGRMHLEQVGPALRAGLPVFIDKPFASTFAEVQAIAALAQQAGSNVFSASALRFADGVASARACGAFACDVYAPCSFEDGHSDFFWYGVHGFEMLQSVLGPGCATVARSTAEHSELVTCTWGNGCVGTYRGLLTGPPRYGGTAFASEGPIQLGGFDGFNELGAQVATFFLDGEIPVTLADTVEIYAAMDAARLSGERHGASVDVAEIHEAAQPEAARLIDRFSNQNNALRRARIEGRTA